MILTQTFFATDQGPSSSSPDVVSAAMEPTHGLRAPPAPAHTGTPSHPQLPHMPVTHSAHHVFGGNQTPHSPVHSPGAGSVSRGGGGGHIGSGGGHHPNDGGSVGGGPLGTPHHGPPGGGHPLAGLGGVPGGHHLGPHGGHMPTSNSNHFTPGLVVPTPQRKTIKSYHCRMCDQIFDNKSDLLVHSQTVHKADPKPYRCPTCQKCFANSSYLSQHARIHAGIKPYKCQICERRFTQLCHLQQHIRTHTGEKPYKCQHPGCGKAFSQLSNLQSHSRSHMTDKPYRCNSCYKCFSDEQGLRDHIPKHSETKHLKTFICRICGKSYTQETYLARHMTKHQGVDPVANMLNLTSLRHQQQQAALQAAQQHAHQQQTQQHLGGHQVNTSVGGLGSPTQLSPTQTTPPHMVGGGGGGHPISLAQHMGQAPPSLHQAQTIHHRVGGPPDLPDIKPLLEGNGFDAAPPGSGDVGGNKPSSAFMPLAHSYPSANMMNTSVPSNFPFGAAPRLPPNTTSALNSPLSRLSPPVNSPPHYFPFEPLGFAKSRDPVVDGRMGMSAEGMLASSLLRLQQIREFSNSVFPKNEPTSPAQLAAAAAQKEYAAAAAHKEYAPKDYSGGV